MSQDLGERTNTFNLRRRNDTGEIQATYELGSQVVGTTAVIGSAILGKDIEECGKGILIHLDSWKSEGVWVNGLQTNIDSIQSDTDKKHNLEPLGQEELAELVTQLNGQRSIFEEGVSMAFTGNSGKEREKVK